MSESNESNKNKDFNEPARIAINRVYTRKGDGGTTALVGGQKVPKSSARIQAYGVVDELNAFVGATVVSLNERVEATPAFGDLARTLVRVQHELFNLGSILATLPQDVHPKQPRVRAQDVTWLESQIDAANESLPALRSFVLPGGTRVNADLHVCRTVARRAERLAIGLGEVDQVDPVSVAYLNRLSDAFFVWSRWAVVAEGGDEVLWAPNAEA